MPGEQIRAAHVDGLLVMYRVFGVVKLDTETIVMTFSVPEELAKEAFESAASEGLVEPDGCGRYGLTSKGEERIDEMVFRGGGSGPIEVGPLEQSTD